FVSGDNFRSFAASRHNQRFNVFCNLSAIPASTLLQYLEFVVIHDYPMCLFDKIAEFVAIEQGYTLAWIKNVRNALFVEIVAVLQHGLPTVRSDNTNLYPFGLADFVEMAVRHRAGMERRDLVVFNIGGDKGLRTEFAGQLTYVAGGNSQRVEMLT